MKKVGIYEAKTHFTKWIDQVAEGETLIITRHGKPVAIMNSYEPADKTDLKQVKNELRHLRKEKTLKGQSIRQMIEEGRR